MSVVRKREKEFGSFGNIFGLGFKGLDRFSIRFCCLGNLRVEIFN